MTPRTPCARIDMRLINSSCGRSGVSGTVVDPHTEKQKVRTHTLGGHAPARSTHRVHARRTRSVHTRAYAQRTRMHTRRHCPAASR